jgi:monoamine oxidase
MRRRLFLGMAGAAAVTPACADDLDVIVLGGGLAGLTAARALMADKKKVLVIEARDRIGGRAFTDTSLGFAFDTGAAWISAGPLAQELGAKPVPGPQAGAVVLGGKALQADKLQEFAKTTQEIAAKLKELREKVPGLDPARVIQPRDQLEQLAFYELLHRAPFEMQQGLEGGVGAAVAHLNAKVPVKLSTRVVRIDTTGSVVEVISTAGSLQARAVIVALPVSVVPNIGFAPPLDLKKRDALSKVAMAAHTRVAIAFSKPVLKTPPDLWLTGVTVSGLPFDALARPQNRNAAILVFNGPAALQVDEMGPSAAGSLALTALAEIYGKEIRTAFKGAVATHWSRDPLAQGAWCLGVTSAVASLVRAPHQERVFFAGEATESEKAGTIEAAPLQAAWASGLRAAAEVKAMLR